MKYLFRTINGIRLIPLKKRGTRGENRNKGKKRGGKSSQPCIIRGNL